MSASRPVVAAAAAMIGDIRCVRPPAPCRPSKLRLEVEAHRSPLPRRCLGSVLEVSGKCRGVPPPAAELVRVHREAHRAAGLPKVEARLRGKGERQRGRGGVRG